MKHLKKFIFVLSLTLIFASCKKDEVSDETTIEGTWKITNFHGTSTSVVTYNGNSGTMTSELSLVSSNSTITFNDDNTYNADGSLEIRTIGFNNGSQVSDITQTSTPQDSGTWSLDGDQLTINTNTGDETIGTIIDQSNNEFTIKSIIHESEDTAGINTTTDGEFYQTLEKQ